MKKARKKMGRTWEIREIGIQEGKDKTKNKGKRDRKNRGSGREEVGERKEYGGK